MIDFLRKHWAACIGLLLAMATAAVGVTVAILSPTFIPMLAALTVFNTKPLAFLIALSPAAAVCVVGIMSFFGSLAASTLFNTVVAVYIHLDFRIRKSIAHADHNNKPLAESINNQPRQHYSSQRITMLLSGDMDNNKAINKASDRNKDNNNDFARNSVMQSNHNSPALS